MTISKEAVKKICEILEIARNLELDDSLILANAFIAQTQKKSKLRGPPELIYMNLTNRVKRRMREGYVPPEDLEKIEAAVLG